MGIRYKNIVRKPKIFLRLTGLKVSEFKEIASKVREVWEVEVNNRKKAVGRPRAMESFEEQLLSLFIYYRTYITHEFVGYLFNMHNSNICRLFKVLEPLVASKINIKKDRTLTKEKILELLIDVTEHPIQRPKKKKQTGKRTPKNKQKIFYSGKKKRHTVKKEIAISETGKIVALSKTIAGRKHDFRIRKEGDKLPKSEKTIVDSGYQGLQKIRKNVLLPFKGTKKRPLTLEQKKHNTELAKSRIKIEHKIREFKVFKIMSETYRNFGKKHNLRSNIIAGVVNIKNGF